MTRTFTHYWKNTTWDAHEDGFALNHTASNLFKQRGVKRGDSVFIVTVADGKLYVAGVLPVDRLVGIREARKVFGTNVWEASDHIIADKAQLFFRNLRVPGKTTRLLRFAGDKPLVFDTTGKLDQQTLRGVRELMPESAAVLRRLLMDAGQDGNNGETEAISEGSASSQPSTTDPTVGATLAGHPFAEEIEEELEILRMHDLSPTQKKQLIMARRGQGTFRDRLIQFEPCCRVTKVSDPNHLRASHMKPWKDSTNEQRLSGDNGLMLGPHVDHLFDKGHISFTDFGDLLVSQSCPASVLEAWGISATLNVGPFRIGQRPFLEHHRRFVYLG